MNPYIWLIVAAIMAIVEAASQGVITVWFVVGGVVAFFCGLAGMNLIVQIIVFLVVSLGCLALFRPTVVKHRSRPGSAEETPVGQNGVVIQQIDRAKLTGRVETSDHMTWAALSSDGSVIPEGTHVRVVGQDSIKLIVERMD